jgi:hypothetical protein
MQLGASILAILWGVMLEHWWVVLAGPISVAFSSSLAAWSERTDLEHQFGKAWQAYRGQVRDWIPRWRPYSSHTAQVFVPTGSRLGQWLRSQDFQHMVVLETQAWHYDSGDGQHEIGLRAFAFALEHLHFGWAMVGWGIRLLTVGFRNSIRADFSERLQ